MQARREQQARQFASPGGTRTAARWFIEKNLKIGFVTCVA